MILLIDHEANRLAVHEGNAARSIGRCQFPANELPLNEKLAINRGKVNEVDVFQARIQFELAYAIAEKPFNLGFLISAGAISKRKGGQIASEADSARNDNVRFRSCATQPFATVTCQVVQIHPTLPLSGEDPVAAQLLRMLLLRRLGLTVVASQVVLHLV